MTIRGLPLPERGRKARERCRGGDATCFFCSRRPFGHLADKRHSGEKFHFFSLRNLTPKNKIPGTHTKTTTMEPSASDAGEAVERAAAAVAAAAAAATRANLQLAPPAPESQSRRAPRRGRGDDDDSSSDDNDDDRSLATGGTTSLSKQQQRKSYTISKSRERWSDEEHERFVEALKAHGRSWRKIEGKSDFFHFFFFTRIHRRKIKWGK